MKKISLLLVLTLLLALLAGCQQKEPETVEPEPDLTEEPEPLTHLDSLTVEISRNGADTEALARAVRELPDLLRDAFADAPAPGQGIGIDEITVTVGASPAATAQALAEGSVDLAFLPAEAFLQYGGGAEALFADAYEVGDGAHYRAGTHALICAAPTEYGGQLANRAAGGQPLTWEELGRARWGVLDAASLGGYRCFDLWLADNYAGNRAADLADVTAYDSYEALFRAAAAGEIDAFSIRDDARTEAADAWTLSASRTADSGMHGFDRPEPIWEEAPVLAVTDNLYATVAAATPELAQSGFSAALEAVLANLSEQQPEQMPVLGAAHFAAVTDGELDAMRRLAALDA